MKRLGRRWLCAVLALVLVVSLAACGSEGGVKVPDEYKDHVSPWELDVAETAKADGKMHYYFMSSEGYMVNPGGQSSTKWGDSCLIVFPDGQTMLIDAGMSGFAPILVLNLQRMGIEKLDYFVLSHPHDDHGYGAVRNQGVLLSFEVGQVYHNGVLNMDWSDPGVLTKTCEEKGIPCDVLKAGDKLTVGEVSIEVLNPDASAEGLLSTNTTEINNSSLVMRFDYGEHSALFTGDIYKTAEKELVKQNRDKLDVDFLKLPHHGGDTSSDTGFVYAVTAELAMATGWDSVDIAAFNRYKGTKTTILMDTEDGYVHVSSGSDGVLAYETSRARGEKSAFGQLPG